MAESALLLIRVIYEWRATASPDKAVYQWALGQLDESLTQEAAERCFRKATALDPGYVSAYQFLASTLAYRGDLAGERECRRKVYVLRPLDPEAIAAYAQSVGASDPALCHKLTEELLTRSAGHAAGANLIFSLSVYERNLTERIAMLEKLLSFFPPSESQATELHTRLLFDAYNRTDPPKALALAQEMAMLLPERSAAKQDWQGFVQYAQSMLIAATLMDRKSYTEAVTLLNKLTPPCLVSADPQTLLLAEATDMAGNTAQAYQILAGAMAEQPSDALLPALIRYGGKLEKTPAQIEDEVWTIGIKKAPVLKDFELNSLLGRKKVWLSDYRGRVVLVDFWYPGEWNCRDDLPQLKQMLEKYGPRGLTVITVNMNPAEDAIAAVLMRRYGFVSLCAPYTGWATRAYKIYSTPTYILIDQRGRALFRPAFWSFDLQHTFELEVEAMLAHKSKR